MPSLCVYTTYNTGPVEDVLAPQVEGPAEPVPDLVLVEADRARAVGRLNPGRVELLFHQRVFQKRPALHRVVVVPVEGAVVQPALRAVDRPRLLLRVHATGVVEVRQHFGASRRRGQHRIVAAQVGRPSFSVSAVVAVVFSASGLGGADASGAFNHFATVTKEEGGNGCVSCENSVTR